VGGCAGRGREWAVLGPLEGGGRRHAGTVGGRRGGRQGGASDSTRRSDRSPRAGWRADASTAPRTSDHHLSLSPIPCAAEQLAIRFTTRQAVAHLGWSGLASARVPPARPTGRRGARHRLGADHLHARWQPAVLARRLVESPARAGLTRRPYSDAAADEEVASIMVSTAAAAPAPSTSTSLDRTIPSNGGHVR